jgi:hypothetical protein
MVLGFLKWWKDVYWFAVSSSIWKQITSKQGRSDTSCSLAMAEMTALVTAVYREYSTSISPGFENKSPAITSRFELFYDETVPEIAVGCSNPKS